MRKLTAALALLLLCALYAAPPPPQARAQDGINVISEEPRNDFPAGVTFRLTFSSPAPLEEVRLFYELAPDGTGATAVVQCGGSASYSCETTIRTEIRPGAEVTYHWTVEDTAGQRLDTPERLYVHQDTRFEFQTISGSNVTVHYYSGSESGARAVLDAAVEALAEAGALMQTQVAFPVKVFLYRTTGEMQPAVAPLGSGLTVLGEVFYSDTAMVASDASVIDTTRHEIGHIVTREATKGPFGISTWMSEGISVFLERHLSFRGDILEAAIRGDRVFSMRELNSGATGRVQETATLFYAQSGSIIGYLVDTYGVEKFAELIRTFREGSTPDKAFETVYDLDQLGVENAWRESVGLSAREAVATPTPRATQEASAAPTSVSGNGASSASGEGDGTPWLTIGVIVALVAVVLATAAFGYNVARQRL